MKNKKTIFLIICLFLISVLIGLTIQYTINYNLSKTISLYNAGSYNVPATITVKKGSTYGDLPSLEKENYIFIGWSTTETGENIISSTTIVGDENMIYPIFHLKTFTLNIDPSNGTYSSSVGVTKINVQYNDSTNIEEPTRIGYDFTGWTLTGNNSSISNNVFKMGNEDATIIANWTPKIYKLTIDLDGGFVDDKNSLEYDIKYNDSIDLSTPTKEGYIFSGYNIENGTIIDSKFVMSDPKDAKLTATWTLKNSDSTIINYYIYNYTMDTNGTSYTLNSIDSNTANLNDTITPQPRNITGFTSPDVESITLDEERNYYIEYKYTRNKYTLTIDANDGNYPEQLVETLYYGETKTLKSPEKNGYNFNTWEISSGVLKDNNFTMPLSDTLIKAKYTPITYNISYDLFDGTVNDLPDTYTIEDNITIPSPSKVGFDFTGWSTKDNIIPVENMIIKNSTGNLHFIANYETAKYHVSLDDNNGSITTIKVLPNSPIGELPTPTKEGCEFLGWFTDVSDGDKISSDTIITSSITYYAHWKYYAVGKILSLKDSNLISDNTNDNNIRYTGNNPDNYVKFNNETWRIIGVMRNVETTNGKSSLVKLVKSTSIGTYSWDSSPSNINRGYGINEWSKSDLMTTLNNTYLNSTSGNCYNDTKEVSTPCDFSSSGLNETSRNYLAEVNWHTGTNGSNAWHFNSNGLVSNFYDYEHSNNNGKICSTSDTCNDTVSRTTSWSGKVGLMYVSDYGYAVNNSTCLKTAIYNWWDNNNCLNSNWLSSNNEWSLTISASNDYAYRVFYLGKSIDTTAASLAYSIRPTIYLTANTIISGGTGTVADPYTLGL